MKYTKKEKIIEQIIMVITALVIKSLIAYLSYTALTKVFDIPNINIFNALQMVMFGYAVFYWVTPTAKSKE